MKRNIVSILIGVLIGLPLSVYADEKRPEPHELLPRPAVESCTIELSEIPDTINENIEILNENIDDENYQADLQLLACLVQAEAGNQDLTGKRLVVDVVLNRVADPRFPDTIPEVIYEPGQFGPVNNGALAKAYYTVTEDDFMAVAMELTDQIDYEICFFTAEGYGCGEPAYKYGGHYFSR